MIERFYLRSCLTFEEAELEFGPGLIVFSGPSGSGKSVLMRALLASVGMDEPLAALSESTVTWQVDEEATGLVNEHPNVLREVKKEKARYFFNGQSLSKAALKKIASGHLRHLSLKDYSDFTAESLLGLLDDTVSENDPAHRERLERYRGAYFELREAEQKLERLKADETRLREQEEFARFEVEKIDRIDPKPGEYEALLSVKKNLSRKEKLEAKLEEAQRVFDHEHTVTGLLEALEIDSAFFDDTMNELRTHFDLARERLGELDGTDIESVLDRLEVLSDLKRRYGGIEEALEYRERKRRELQTFESFEEELASLRSRIETLRETLEAEASLLSKARRGILAAVNERINTFLEALYLDDARLSLEEGGLGPFGRDTALLSLKGTPLQKISSGEFNRLRLALLAVKAESMEGQQGVLMLDEIDANLSGEESMSVAKVLRTLSRNFQIFVISHQPQLTAMGEQHFLVSKTDRSTVRELTSDEERIEEIARIVSGDTVTEKARHLARELLEAASLR